MPDLPTGTVTFLFSDIAGSTDLLRRLGDARYSEIRALHHRHVRDALRAHGGTEVDTQGDGFFASFPTARGALGCAVQILRTLHAQPWPDGIAIRVRMGLHTGEPYTGGVGYVGLDVHRAARICGVAHGGQILLSQASHALVEHDLPGDVTVRDLGEHRLKDLPHAERIYQVVLADVPSEFPALRSLDSRPNNLPRPLTTFIGRGREIAEVTRLLDEAQLLTLTGPGGCGKTRLAVAVASRLLDQFPDGVWFIDLSPVSDPHLLPQAISAALGLLGDRDRTSVDSLASYLDGRATLLILDTCEHLRDACAELVSAVIRMPRGPRCMVTSREVLGIPGEIAFPVPPLSMPPTGDVPSMQALADSEAVQLFLERARLALPEAGPMLAALAEIVRRLEGIPLAIELAAAKTRILSLPEIALRLSHRLRLLDGARGPRPGRHRTLRGTIDWSYDLLSESERRLLRRLAVCSGGCSLEAATGICPEEDASELVVLDILTSLADKSLVVVDRSNPEQTRYRLLDTIREYALERLVEAGEADAVRTRHRDWYLRAVEALASSLARADTGALNLAETEHDNIRAALAWSLSRREVEHALRMALAVARFWQVRGYWIEGLRWFEHALQLGVEVSRPLTMQALLKRGLFATYQGESDLVVRLAGDARTLAAELGDLSAEGRALNLLASVEYYRDRYARARALYEESLSYARRARDESLEANCLLDLATIALHDDQQYEDATRLARQCLERFGSVGDPLGAAFAYIILGVIATDTGHHADANAFLKNSLTLAQRLGDRRSEAISLGHLGRTARNRGDYAAAEQAYREASDLRRDLGDGRGLASALCGLGVSRGLSGRVAEGLAALEESLRIRLKRNDPYGVAECLEGIGCISTDVRQCVMLLAAAGKIREDLKTPSPPAERRIIEDRIRELRELVGDDVFDRAWQEGARKGLLAAPPLLDRAAG